VEIRGVPEREVKVSVDLYQLEALQLNFDDIANAVRSENLTMSGGEILTGGQRRAVRVIGEFTDMDQVRDIVVKNEDQRRCAWATSPRDFAYKEPDQLRP
jgi:multidrug efflux pump